MNANIPGAQPQQNQVSFGAVPYAASSGQMGGYVNNQQNTSPSQLPFQKSTTSTPNMGMIDPALAAWTGAIKGMTPPDYSSYFNQLSQFAYGDARKQAGQIAAQHGGAPTAQGGDVVGGNQAAVEAMLGEQLNRENVNRMWTSEDQWRQQQAAATNQAYGNYFNQIANRAYGTDETGYQSGFAPGGGSAFNFGSGQQSGGSPSAGGSPTGGAAGGAPGSAPGAAPIGGSAPGSAPGSPTNNYTDFWNQPGYPGGPNEGAQPTTNPYSDFWNQPGYPGGPNEGTGPNGFDPNTMEYSPSGRVNWIATGMPVGVMNPNERT
jgi:hypothetical protein